jgi:type VI secretion system protein
MRSWFGGNVRADVRVDRQANLNSPVAVSVVVVRDKDLLDRLIELPAAQYFEQREQLQRDFPKDLDEWSWEWVPGQVVAPLSLRFRAGAKGGLVFADYLTEGDHRARFDPYRPFRLVLGETELSLIFERKSRGPSTPLEVGS